jgi:hypothetical protein
MNRFFATLARLLSLAATLATAGCGDATPKQDLQLLQTSVQTALDAWKEGQRADVLKSQTPAIEFHDDDWQQSARLIDYQIVKIYPETDGTARCAVSLTLQRRGRQPEQVKATYQMNPEPKLIIARDPYS